MTLRTSTPILFLAGLSAMLAGCGKQENAAASAPPPAAPVVVVQAEKRDVPVEVRSIGNVETIETVAIKSQITGQIVAVHFKEGQDVQKGDLLFEIDPRQAKADLAKAESNLAKDLADAKNARVDAERYAKLVAEGVVSKQQYDQFLAAAESKDAAVEADKAAVEFARLQLQYTRIYAPITGRTGNLMVTVGNIVKANETPALVTINQISPIYVSFNVPEQQLPEVKRMWNTGLKVAAAPKDDPQNPVQGRLTFIDNAVDPATATIKLKATFANTDRKLWPGQFVDVFLTLSTTPNATVIPSQAIQTGQSGPYVFVIGADLTADMRPVKVDRTFGGLSVIQEGVKPGERVVIDGQIRLTKGTKVEIKQSAVTAPAVVSGD
jgi:multidrug efflux system membrane fusion protein